MTVDLIIPVFKVAYIFGWLTFLCTALTTYIPKRTTQMDIAMAVFSVFWPFFTIPAIVSTIADKLAEKHK